MQLHQVGNINTGFWIHLGDESWQECLNNKLGVALNALIHGNILIQTQRVKVETDYVVEDITEASNEVFQELGGVDAENIIHELYGHQAEVDGCVAEVHYAIVDKVAEFSHAQWLHLKDDSYVFACACMCKHNTHACV